MTQQKSYSEQLLHPKWQKKKSNILKRDEWKCQECGCTETTLHVHHKSYIYGNEVWDYPDTNFITLCEDCHQRVGVIKKQIKTLIDNNFVTGDYLGELLMILDCIKELNPYELYRIRKRVLNNPSRFIIDQVQDIKDNLFNLTRDIEYFFETNKEKINEITQNEPPF